jgi:hypothetical protein
MRDDGGEHDAADDERPGGVPTNPKHVSASVSVSTRKMGITAEEGLPFPNDPVAGAYGLGRRSATLVKLVGKTLRSV